jgi:hypothetical protein
MIALSLISFIAAPSSLSLNFRRAEIRRLSTRVVKKRAEEW